MTQDRSSRGAFLLSFDQTLSTGQTLNLPELPKVPLLSTGRRPSSSRNSRSPTIVHRTETFFLPKVPVMSTGRTDLFLPKVPLLSAGRRPSSSCRNCPQVPAFGNCAGHVTKAVAARAAAVTKLRASAFRHVDEMPMRSLLSSTCRELERVVTRVLPRDFCDFLRSVRRRRCRRRRRRRRRDLSQNARSPLPFQPFSTTNN